MKHDLCTQMQWCKACGLPMDEIVDQNLRECTPTAEGAQRYKWALARFSRLMDPIIDKVLKDLK